MFDGVAILGPTASGKSALALELAEAIIACDSAQIYRGFDIGTAKPTKEEQQKCSHFGIDLVDWDEPFDAGQYAEYARNVFQKLREQGKKPFVVGGTGLYFRAFLGEGWDDLPSDAAVRKSFSERSLPDLYKELQSRDPRRAEDIHPNDRFRIERALEVILVSGKTVSEFFAQEKASSSFRLFTIVLDPPRSKLESSLTQRSEMMLRQGFIEEVEGLRKMGVDPQSKPMRTIGYASVNDFLDGKLSRERLAEDITKESMRYARKQRTWFSRMKVDLVLSLDKSVRGQVTKSFWDH